MTIPTQQKALLLPEPHAPFVVRTVDVYKPEAGEVLVRVEATALNPVDWKIQAWNFLVDEYPAVVGTDITGTVVELGEGVTNVAVGDKIVWQGWFANRLASFQQYTIAKVDRVAKIPPSVSFEQAATIPVGAAAAYVGLYGIKQKEGGANLTPSWIEGGRGNYTGQPIVIFGGSSSVGQYAIQFAKLSGFSPIITTASPRNYDHVKSLGATHTINRSLSPSDIVAEVKKITSEPVQIVYDAISEEDTQNTAYDILAPGGTVVITLAQNVAQEKIGKDKSIIHTLGNVHIEHNHALGVGFFSHLTEYLASGDIKPNQFELVPGGLEAIPKGLERLRNGEVSARKLVVNPNETV
ncbi:unnamed protein product [Somion occarium]|uniref:Enoyl reductase (ER) domain-containing protein n=1 Tax=Somion occarium TaxID=3059160 RepID=A0ABP1EB36_9APHY